MKNTKKKSTTPKITLKYINRYHSNDTELGQYLRVKKIDVKNLVSNHEELTNNKLGKTFRKNLGMFEAICNLNINSWE